MSQGIRVFAGECTTTFEGTRDREQRGDVVVLIKPDNTVLVHDADGYRPVAWLTRAQTLAYEHDDGFALTAADGDQRLRVVAHGEHGGAHYPASTAGSPVGTCPGCDATLVRAGGAVTCLGCEERYGLPAGAVVLADTCSCGLPRMDVERGDAFEVCIDYACESLDDAVRERFDRAWDCPECGAALRVLRRGGLIAGCERYPECETGFSIPDGTVAGDCDCGLPAFDTPSGQRCLDAACGR